MYNVISMLTRWLRHCCLESEGISASFQVTRSTRAHGKYWWLWRMGSSHTHYTTGPELSFMLLLGVVLLGLAGWGDLGSCFTRDQKSPMPLYRLHLRICMLTH